MKNKLEDLNKRLSNCQNSLKETEPEILKRRLRENAFELANLYLKTLFQKLGFDVREGRYYDSLQMESCRYVPETWYLDKDSLTVNIEAQISSQMREAFIKIGVLTKEERNEDPLEVQYPKQ